MTSIAPSPATSRRPHLDVFGRSRASASATSWGMPSPAAVLDQFGVPSARYDASGRLVGVSAAAGELLGDSMEAALHRATRLVAELLALAGHRRHARVSGALSAPGVHGNTTLRAQLLPPGDADHAIVVLFLASRPANDGPGGAHAWGLSKREGEVARQIATGASSKEIASRLGISLHTVRRHTERVFAKLGVQSRSQVVLLMGAHQGGRD